MHADQHQRGDTQLVDAFATSLNDCCAGLRAKRDLFTAYGQLLLEELSAFAETLDFGLAETGFRRFDLAAA